MSDPLDRWEREHKEKQGAYWAFVGFEKDIKTKGKANLPEAYAAMEVYDQIALFGFVCDLLDERDMDCELQLAKAKKGA